MPKRKKEEERGKKDYAARYCIKGQLGNFNNRNEIFKDICKGLGKWE